MFSKLHGIYTALVTPFASGGAQINETALRFLVDANIEAGVHGLIPCGSTGEFASLNLEERKLVTEITIDQAAGRVPVVPQTGSTSMIEAIHLSQHAEKHGAAGVMVVFPFYEPISFDEIFSYYQYISDAIHIPIMVYNSPSGTGKNLPPKFLGRLGREIENVQYVKDSSASLPLLTELIWRHSEEITPFNGWDTMLFSGFELGCQGAVMGPANVIPYECAKIYNLVVEGRLKEGLQLYERIWPIMQFFEENTYNAAIKAGTKLMGHDVGDVRPPFHPLPPDKVHELKLVLEAAGVLKDSSSVPAV